MGNTAVLPDVSGRAAPAGIQGEQKPQHTFFRTTKTKPVIGYKRLDTAISSSAKSPMNAPQVATLTQDDLQWRYYVKTYREGDPELPEDPQFPRRLLEQVQEQDFPSESEAAGTYVFYPDKSRPKLWVGKYRCLNPEDLLTCGMEDGCIAAGEVMGCWGAEDGVDVHDTSEDLGKPADKAKEEQGSEMKSKKKSVFGLPTCGLTDICLRVKSNTEENLVSKLRGGESFMPDVPATEAERAQRLLERSVKENMAVACGTQYAHENLSSRLALAQELRSNDLAATFGPYVYQQRLLPYHSANPMLPPSSPTVPRGASSFPVPYATSTAAAGATSPRPNSYPSTNVPAGAVGTPFF